MLGTAERAAVDRHVPRHRAPAAAHPLARGGPAAGASRSSTRTTSCALIRKLLKTLDLDESRWVPKEIMWFINAQQGRGPAREALEGRRRPDAPPVHPPVRALPGAVRAQRRGRFRGAAAARFELWRDRPDVLAHYRARFRHVLVDEFQDTNAIQYDWLKLLAGDGGLPFVVGDDDQSIYRWRGARVENLQQFRRDYPDVQLFRLEQNYRSTGNDPRRGQRAHRQQQRPDRQESVDQPASGASRSGSTPRSTSATRRTSSSTASASGAQGRPAPRLRDPLSLQRAVARLRRSADRGAHSVSRVRRTAVLRARGDQGRAGVSAPARSAAPTTRRSSAS